MSSIVLAMLGIAVVFLPFIYAANVIEEYNKKVICEKVIDMAGLTGVLK